MSFEVVLATRNADKVGEISAILTPLDVRVRSLSEFPDAPEVEEDGATLRDNALKKARVIRDATGLCALADDTGLEVDALDGAPGIYAARYAGEGSSYEENYRKLLAEMSGVEASLRTARFRTVMALALVSPYVERVAEVGRETHAEDALKSGVDAIVTQGLLNGCITESTRGEYGFGYDPVFEIPTHRRTLAEMTADEKNSMSHRYRAMVEMRELVLRFQLASVPVSRKAE